MARWRNATWRTVRVMRFFRSTGRRSSSVPQERLCAARHVDIMRPCVIVLQLGLSFAAVFASKVGGLWAAIDVARRRRNPSSLSTHVLCSTRRAALPLMPLFCELAARKTPFWNGDM